MSQYYLHVQELVEGGEIAPVMIQQLAKECGVSEMFIEQTIKSIKESVNVA